MGKDAHVLTFPIDYGETCNLFACRKNPKDWPSSSDHLTLPAKREEALEDFKHFGPSVIKLIKMTKENLDRVSIINFQGEA